MSSLLVRCASELGCETVPSELAALHHGGFRSVKAGACPGRPESRDLACPVAARSEQSARLGRRRPVIVM